MPAYPQTQNQIGEPVVLEDDGGGLPTLPAVNGKQLIDVPAILPKIVDNILTTGLRTGGELSINGGDNTKFDLAAGSGLVVNNHADPLNPTVIEVSWSAFTLQTPTGLGSTYATAVGIDSTGALVQQATDFTSTQLRDVIRIGVVVHIGATISSVLTDPHVAFNKHLEFLDFVEAFGPLNINGNVYSANGANLKLNKTAGSGYRTGANYANSKKLPSITTEPLQTALSFFYTYQAAGSGWTISAPTTDIVPGAYDDGDGTLGAVGAAQWTIQTIFVFPGTANTLIHYGQALYASLEDAEAAHKETTLFNPFVAEGVFRCWLIVRGNATNLSDPTQALFITAGKFGLSDVVTGGGSGESNTASNVGTAGVGIFKTKTGVDLAFKKINAGSSKITVTDDVGNDEVDIDLGLHATTHKHGGTDEVATATPAANAIPKADATGDLDNGWLRDIIKDHYRWCQAFFNGTTAPYLAIKTSGTYQIVCRFLFPGTNVLALAPSAARTIISRQTTGITVSVRIYDLTNAQTIAEATGLTPTDDDANPTVQDLGTVQNLPTGPAVFELQVASSSAAASAEIHWAGLCA